MQPAGMLMEMRLPCHQGVPSVVVSGDELGIKDSKRGGY